MPTFDRITYSGHAFARMRRRRISTDDVRLTPRVGEGYYDEEDDTWTYVLGHVAVVISERDDSAHVITVMRVREHT